MLYRVSQCSHREGVEGVVDLELAHHARGGVVHEGGDDADDDGRPRVDRRTASGDANERAEERVAGVADVVQAGAAELRGQAPLDEKARETAHCGGEGRGDGGARHGVRVAMDDQGGAGVEAVPAEPEEEGADELERGGVALELLVGLGLGLGLELLVGLG